VNSRNRRTALAVQTFFSTLFACLLASIFFSQVCFAQQTLGSIEGTTTDASGAVLRNVKVKLHNVGTGFEQTTVSNSNGGYRFQDLPIGTYTVSFSLEGFNSQEHNGVSVFANRTTTESATMQVGKISETVQVTASNSLNQVDTTNGYVLGESIIQNTPLGTGSFTQLALLSPGVHADLLAGSGSGTGLGNQAIFANGQRDTSNSFTLNAISGNNLFNGNSTSQVGGNRFVLNTGENFNNSSGEIQTSTSVYDAIGEALPTPPQETLEELRVNTSMYDVSQGANSGAHIGLITKSGTNTIHGQVYEYFQNSFWNAAPYFRNAAPDAVIPANQKVPALHYNRFGVTLGGPVVKDKLFFFASYQGIRVTDQLLGTSQANVPLHLTDDRSATALMSVAQQDFGTTVAAVDPVALQLLQTKLPNGQYLIPSAQITDPTIASTLGYDVLIQGTPSVFHADQANFNLDYNAGSKDRVALKYYYQHSPTTNPFASQGGGSSGGGTLGFPQELDAGSHVISLDNTTNVTSHTVWEQRIGFVREKAFASTGQPFTPQQFGINLFGSQRFPGISIDNNGGTQTNYAGGLSFGPVTNFANAGMFQNRFAGSTDFNWIHGRHNVSSGMNWDYVQLNVENLNNQVAGLEFRDFPSFLSGTIRPGLGHSVLFNGTSNRHYRANEAGAYAQDKIALAKNFNMTLGLRWDWDGPLWEKDGLMTNFYPSQYSYSLGTDTINNIGLVVAGNNPTLGTKGVSNSTLTGRQWGFAPRVGFVWTPNRPKNFVIRASYGIFYDRGEFFTEFSPSAGFGYNGPFGVTLEPPFTVPVPATSSSTFTNPFGTTAPAPPPNNLSSVVALVPNQAGLINGTTPFLFGGYDPRNKLPYSENWGLDFQMQPAEDLVFTLGYLGNHGVHLTMPIPFNQPGIATPQNPINGQIYSYGYQPGDPNDPNFGTLLSQPYNTSTGGNTDLRAPYIGYSPNSVFWTANGISNYNALQAGLNKKMKHGLQISGSYTWSHSLDEQSGLGLFYNGNNPLNPRSSYASSDFDRTHVGVASFLYQLPTFQSGSGLKKGFLNGWGVTSTMVFESGQPYNVYDFSGSVGSLYYSANDFITNPVVPLAPGFSPISATQHGSPGATPPVPSLNPSAFAIPQLAPGQDGVPPCGPTTTGFETFCDTVENTFSSGGRNIFRGPFQARVDFSVLKDTKINERFTLKYQADFFNILNHTSFDTPNNNVTFNPCFNPDPCYTFPPQGQLGLIQHTLGSPRFIQMALHLTF
jgi:hypothetical protein